MSDLGAVVPLLFELYDKWMDEAWLVYSTKIADREIYRKILPGGSAFGYRVRWILDQVNWLIG